MAEIDYLLSLDDAGVIVLQGSDANLNNLREWMDTPEGSVFGMPWFGHTFEHYKHETLNEDILLVIENSTVLKLLKDIPTLRVGGVKSTMTGIDSATIEISTNDGVVSKKL